MISKDGGYKLKNISLRPYQTLELTTIFFLFAKDQQMLKEVVDFY
jgi:hypothetical protein